MKTVTSTLFLSFFVLLFSHFSNAQVLEKGAKISVNKEVHDYGSLKQGGNGECDFVIKNDGNEPLVLATVKGSCQCTVPTWPTEPIAPGATGVIHVKYNTENVGPISKTVTISSNAVNEPVKVLRISGNVLPRPEGASPETKVGPTNN